MDLRRARDAASFALVMFSMAACVPLFFLGPSAYEAGLSEEQAVAAALAGNLVVAAAIALNGHAGAVWGADFPRQAEWVYGRLGARIAVALRGLVGALWFGVEAFTGALALAMIAVSYAGLGVDPLGIVPAMLAVYLALLALVLARGAEGIARASSVAGPLLLAYFAWLLASLEAGGAEPRPEPRGVGWASAAFLTYLAVQTNWWATVAVNASDLTRAARGWGSVWLGVIAGLVGGQVLGTWIGYRLAELTGLVLPHEMILEGAPSAAAALLGLSFVFLAPWTTDLTANAPALADLVKSLTGASWRKSALAASALGFVLAPWWAFDRAEEIVGYVSGFAAAYGVILGPVLGPMLAAYWWLWRARPPRAPARGRLAAAALAAMALGVAAAYVHSVALGAVAWAHLGLLAAPFPVGPTWYTGVATSALAYLALARLALGRRGLPGHPERVLEIEGGQVVGAHGDLDYDGPTARV